jgi:rod shape-determining protein MreC
VDRSPPAFFKQGYSANARLAFFSLLAIALLFVDSRLNVLSTLRQGLGMVLYPVQILLLQPRDAAVVGSEYLNDITKLRNENNELKKLEILNAQALLNAEQLAAENAQLRALVGAREKTSVSSLAVEVLYENRDAFTRKLVLDKGQTSGIKLGMPVIDPKGVVGQITRLFPLTAEVTVITDRNAAIPVQFQRTNQRTVAFGGVDGNRIELRYLPLNTDVKEGDVVATSGLDGVFPPGLPVGKVIRLERGASNSFARVLLEPLAAVDSTKLMMVLLVDNDALPSKPPLEGPTDGKKNGKRG